MTTRYAFPHVELLGLLVCPECRELLESVLDEGCLRCINLKCRRTYQIRHGVVELLSLKSEKEKKKEGGIKVLTKMVEAYLKGKRKPSLKAFEGEKERALAVLENDSTRLYTMNEDRFDKLVEGLGGKLSKGQYFVFVFAKPLSRTNVQYQELYSLLQMQAPESTIDIREDRDSFDFEGQTLIGPSEIQILKYTQCCVVRTNIELDLQWMVKRAGCIHSCGYLILDELWEKVTTEQIVQAAKDYLDDRCRRFDMQMDFYTLTGPLVDKAIDFTDVLIDANRFFVENEHYGVKSERIGRKVKRYSTTQRYEEGEGTILALRAVETIVAGVSEEPIYWSREPDFHFLAFHCPSGCMKKNPLHELGEFKPYCIGPYTTPPELVAAMLNIAKVEKNDVVFDPFSHAATLALEAAKIGCRVIYGDYVEALGGKDNVDFLLDAKNSRENLRKLAQLQTGEAGYEELDGKIRALARSTVKVPKKEEDFPEPKEEIQELIESNECLQEKEGSLPSSIKRVYFYLVRQYHMLKETTRVADVTVRQSTKKGLDRLEDYFNAVTRYGEDYPELGEWERLAVLADARELPVMDNSLDVVIADPPYGYGSGLTDAQVYEVYHDFLQRAFEALKDGGRLVVCMLDQVKSGKPVGERVRSERIINLIDKIAKQSDLGISFVTPSPTSCEEARSLLYWKERHALNRAIIAVQLLKKVPSTQRVAIEYPLKGFGNQTKLVNQIEKIRELRRKGKLTNARKECEALIQDHPDNAFLHIELARVFQDEGKLARALYELEEAIKCDRENPFIFDRYASLYAQAGDLFRAKEMCHKAVDLVRTRSEFQEDRYLVLDKFSYILWKLGDIDDAIDAAREACNSIPAGSSPHVKWIMANNLAYYLAERGYDADVQEALTIAEKELKGREHIITDFTETLGFTYVRAFEKNGDYHYLQEGIRLLTIAHSKDPRNLYAAQHLRQARELLEAKAS